MMIGVSRDRKTCSEGSEIMESAAIEQVVSVESQFTFAV